MQDSPDWRSVAYVARISDDGRQHLGLLRSRQRESGGSTSERCARLVSLPAKRQPGGVRGLEIPLPVRRRCLLLNAAQHMWDAGCVGYRAAARPCGVVERLAYEFEQVDARLRRSCAACGNREQQVHDVLAFLAVLLCLRTGRRASPYGQGLGFGRERRHAQELHVLRQSVAQLARDRVELFAIRQNLHVVVDEVQQRLPLGLRVVVELHLAGAVQQDCRGDEGDVSAGLLARVFVMVETRMRPT